MTGILALFSVFMIAGSVYGMIFPTELLSQVSEFIIKSLWIAVVVRLFLAVLLWFSATRSRTPITFKVLAVLAMLGAVAIPLIGSERLLMLIAWYSELPVWMVRVQISVGLAFGTFLLWSISASWAESTTDHLD